MDVVQFVGSLLDLHRQQLQALARQGEIQAAVLAQLLEGEGPGSGGGALRMPRLKLEEGNPEAYLSVFEQAAASCRLPRVQWGARLAGLIGQEAQKEVCPTSTSSTLPEYEALKARILSQVRAEEDESWQVFSTVRYEPLKGARDLGLHLSEAADRWLRPQRRTAAEVVQQVAMQQFVSLLPEEAKAWVNKQCPGSMEEAIRLAEQHLSPSNGEGAPAHAQIELETETLPRPGQGERSAELRVNCDQMDAHERLTEPFINKQESASLYQSASFNLEVQELGDLYMAAEGAVEGAVEAQALGKIEGFYFAQPAKAERKRILTKPNQMPVFTIDERGVPNSTPQLSQALEGHSPTLAPSLMGPEGPASGLQASHTPLPSGALRVGAQRSPNKRKFECPECGRCYTRAGHLERHKCSDSAAQTYICPCCDRAFSSSKQLNHHLRMHEKPHACADCGKRFRDRYNLRCHQRTHTGERPHQCPDCGHAFAQERGLREHRNIHTGEKPFRCQECGKGFHHSRTLSKHCQLHSADRPYLCAQCGWTFKLKDSLKKHQLTHNKEKANAGSLSWPQGLLKNSDQSLERVS